jgi:predicted MFS family arabinose efflux permease
MFLLFLSFTQLWTNLALNWFILVLTDSPLLLGITVFFRRFSSFFFGFIAGVIADRYDRRKILILTQLATVGLEFLLATIILTGSIQLWQVFTIIFLFGALWDLSFPARQTLIPQLVEDSDLMNALSLQSLTQGTMGILGSGIGGMLVDAIGVANCYYLSGAIKGVSIGLLLLIRGLPEVSSKGRSPFRDLIEGFRYIRGNRPLFGAISMHGILQIFILPLPSLITVVARDVLGLGATGLGFLESARSAGNMVCMFVMSSLGEIRSKGKMIFVASGLVCLLWILFSLSPWFLLSLVLIFGVGAFQSLFQLVKSVLFVVTSSDEMRGRAMGVRSWLMVLIGAGNLWTGALAESMGAPFTISLAGCFFGLSALAIAWLIPKLRKY